MIDTNIEKSYTIVIISFLVLFFFMSYPALEIAQNLIPDRNFRTLTMLFLFSAILYILCGVVLDNGVECDDKISRGNRKE